MKVAIYGNKYHESQSCIHQLLDELLSHNIEIIMYQPLFESSVDRSIYKTIIKSFFTCYNDLDKNIDFLISLGGDGTFLETLKLIRKEGIPVIGINTGRLGFLANISKKKLTHAISQIIKKEYDIEQRLLIKMDDAEDLFGDFPYALNEITIQKKNSSMIIIHVYQDDKLLNTYWTDGLIISTPTGSTAYSLSVGGPVIVPGTDSFIISPIAPHNLTVRPLVLPAHNNLTISVSARNGEYLVSADSETAVTNVSKVLKISAGEFKMNVLRLKEQSFYDTLRNKLMWGADVRNKL